MNQRLTNGLLVVAIVISGIALYKAVYPIKVAYIRSGELIYSYEGMKESQKLLKEKTEKSQANVDTLRMELERAYNGYVKKSAALSAKEKKEHQELLQRQQQNYLQYEQAMKEKEKKEETEMMQSVLNQVNSFVEQYGKEKGYDIVFGTTNSGNLLYATDRMDITKEVLEALNANYSSGENKQ